MLVTKNQLVATDFHSIFFLQKSKATSNCLVTSILQNSFFSFQQTKETHTGLEQDEVK